MKSRIDQASGRTTRRIARAAALATVLLLGALWTAGAAVAAPGDVVWRDLTQRLPGSDDAYAALAVSPAGQVCAAGSTAVAPGNPADVLVRLCDQGGSVLWTRVWTWPGHSDDDAVAVTRDSHGGYIVAGSSGPCWLLLKYTTRGYLQWVRRGKGSFARCALTAVAADGSGAVYAAGAATPAGGGSRLFALKCSTSGAVRWQRTYGGGDGDAAATDVVTGDGGAYVAGRVTIGGGAAACLTRFTAHGTRRWEREYVAPGATSAQAASVAYASGPVVAGWSTAAGGADDGFVAAYTADGRRQWLAGYDDAGVAADRFRDIAASASGHVCVVGDAQTSDGARTLAASFDAAGTPLWSRTGPGIQGFAVCRVPDGFAYTGGTTSLSAVHLTSTGTVAWERSLSPGGYGDFRPVALQAAGSMYLYAAGSAATENGGRASILVRYRP